MNDIVESANYTLFFNVFICLSASCVLLAEDGDCESVPTTITGDWMVSSAGIWQGQKVSQDLYFKHSEALYRMQVYIMLCCVVLCYVYVREREGERRRHLSLSYC